jgi:hypothetical protein
MSAAYEKPRPGGTSGNSRNGTRVKSMLAGHRTNVQRVIRLAYTIELLSGPRTIDLADPVLVRTIVRARGWYSSACSQDGSEDDDCPSRTLRKPSLSLPGDVAGDWSRYDYRSRR